MDARQRRALVFLLRGHDAPRLPLPTMQSDGGRSFQRLAVANPLRPLRNAAMSFRLHCVSGRRESVAYPLHRADLLRQAALA